MSINFRLFIIIFNLFCLPVNVWTFKRNLQFFHEGHPYFGVAGMMLATLCFAWCLLVAISHTRILLKARQ